MPMDPRHAVLFEPVKIGPHLAPNRFYQTPHATGFGWQRPQASAALRGVKAEGGWGVVCTEYCSIHPSSDDSPSAYLTLWGEEDVAHRLEPVRPPFLRKAGARAARPRRQAKIEAIFIARFVEIVEGVGHREAHDLDGRARYAQLRLDRRHHVRGDVHSPTPSSPGPL